jgi:O-antigen/teichoic acid export membrane protein
MDVDLHDSGAQEDKVAEVKQKAMSGIKWTGFTSFFNGGVQLLLFLLLSHLITPRDWGLYTIIYVIIVLSYYFIDAGISNSLFAKKDITDRQLSTLYWINIISGVVITAITFLGASVIADFYGEPELEYLIKITSGLFLIIPIGMQYRFLFQKILDFKTIGIIETLGTVLNLVVSLIFAMQGKGALSLIFGAYAKHIFESAAYFFRGLSIHVPGLVFRLEEVSFFLKFGLFQMGEKMIEYVSGQLDFVFIGKLLGTESLGYYSFAKNIVMRPVLLVNPVITKVTTPLFAQFQDESDYLKRLFIKTLNRIATVNFAIFSVIIISGAYLIPLFFGAKWLPALSALQVLSFYAMISSLGNPLGSLLIAKGRADWGFYLNTIMLVITASAIYLGSFYGTTGVALALVIVQMLLVYPVFKTIIARLIPISFGEYIKSIQKPVIINLLSAIPALAYIWLFNNGRIVDFTIVLGLYGITFIVLVGIFGKELIADVKKLR